MGVREDEVRLFTLQFISIIMVILLDIQISAKVNISVFFIFWRFDRRKRALLDFGLGHFLELQGGLALSCTDETFRG